MEIKKLECPSCGASLNASENDTIVTCRYCGQSFYIKKDILTSINNTNITKKTKIDLTFIWTFCMFFCMFGSITDKDYFATILFVIAGLLPIKEIKNKIKLNNRIIWIIAVGLFFLGMALVI